MINSNLRLLVEARGGLLTCHLTSGRRLASHALASRALVRRRFSSSAPPPHTSLFPPSIDVRETSRDVFVQSADALWVPPSQRTVFGGQIAAAAMVAVSLTSELPCHAFASFFLARSEAGTPVSYRVDRLRDGSSFEVRSVTATQRGIAIFTAHAGFHRVEATDPQVGHQPLAPSCPPPESLPSQQARLEELLRDPRLPPAMRPHVAAHVASGDDSNGRAHFPVELRPVAPRDLLAPEPSWPPRRLVWMRFADALPPPNAPGAAIAHRAAVVYCSDWALAETALLPYNLSWGSAQMSLAASLTHTLHFHDAFDGSAPRGFLDKRGGSSSAPGSASGGVTGSGSSGSASVSGSAAAPRGGALRPLPPVQRHSSAPPVPLAPAPPVHAGEWLLYELEGGVLRGARALTSGRVFARDGRLVASIVQEALLRTHVPGSGGRNAESDES